MDEKKFIYFKRKGFKKVYLIKKNKLKKLKKLAKIF